VNRTAIVAPEVSSLYPMAHPIHHRCLRRPIVDTGKVVTGGGVSLFIDTTLYSVAKMAGHDVTHDTARILEYERARKADQDVDVFLGQVSRRKTSASP
jgi:transcriptional regulator GlxA family with amidase domain